MRFMKYLLPLAAVCTLAAQEPPTPRLAVIVMDKVVQGTARGHQLFAELETLDKKIQEKLKGLDDTMNQLKNQLASPSTADSARETLQRQLREAEFAFKTGQDDARAEFQKTQQKITQQFLQEVGPIVETLAKEQKLQLVLNYQQGVMFWMEEGWSLAFTNEVAKRYDAKYAPDAAAPAPKPAAPKPAVKK